MHNPFEWAVGRYPELDRRACQLAELVQRQPDRKRMPELFTPACLEQLPPRTMAAQLADTWQQYGAPRWVEPVKVLAENSGAFLLVTDRNYRIQVRFTLEVEEPHRIATFRTFPQKLRKSFKAVVSALGRLPGSTGLCLARLGPQGDRILLGHRDDAPLGIASAYKLYVLAALMQAVKQEGWRWDHVLELRDEDRTFPTGDLRAWPTGSPLTLQSLATLMIAQSDNTAASCLIDHLGQGRFADLLPVVGNRNPEMLTPMLTSGDANRLRREPETARRYQEEDATGRRHILEYLRSIEMPWVLPARPLALELGWRASAGDLCRLLSWIRRESKDGPVRDILAVNPGAPVSFSRWPYAGYKGGAEAGIVAANYLLRDPHGHWFALSAGWNRSDGQVDQEVFFSLVESLLFLLPMGLLGAPSGPLLAQPS